MSHRVLIVDRDATQRAWLSAHIGAILQEAQIEAIDVDAFRGRFESLDLSVCDLLLLSVGFGTSPEDPASEGLNWLRRLRDRRNLPPIVAIADGGNELTAVRALRLGAAEYLPRSLLSPQRLGTAVKIALRVLARRTQPHAKAATLPPAKPKKAADGTVGHRKRVPRDLIPRYTLLDTLGESARAIVYLATSLELETQVALKVSRRDTSEAQDAVTQLFAQEYEAISAIAHPAVVDIYDYGLHDGLEYLAMEYFPRGDLKARLRQALGTETAIYYAWHVAQALEVVHKCGLVHRDLKPPNVMLRENDDIVLIDFGLARSMDGTGTATRSGVLRGSPYYMSPEQAQGGELDARTDLYSLGVMLFEMLAARKPFTGGTAMEVLQQHVSAPIPLLPIEHARFQPLVARLLAKSADDRFNSAAEVSAALADFASNEIRVEPVPA